ncbi:MAG: hypothetical protein IJ499_05030 [Clostridia bacterium]|nr:hypothetical protein [Clostridia bacterium]
MNTVTLTKSDEELLCELHRNLEMCAESTTQVIGKIDDKELLSLLTEVVMKSVELNKRSEKLMHERGITPEKISKMKEIMTDAGIMMNTLFDSSDPHIAEMMVKGLEMGVVTLRDLTKRLGETKDSEINALANDVAEFESTYAHKIGKFAQ